MEANKKEKDNCVSLNIYVNCDKCNKKDSYDDPCRKPEHEKEDKDCNCIEINVYVECDKKSKKTYSYKESL